MNSGVPLGPCSGPTTHIRMKAVQTQGTQGISRAQAEVWLDSAQGRCPAGVRPRRRRLAPARVWVLCRKRSSCVAWLLGGPPADPLKTSQVFWTLGPPPKPSMRSGGSPFNPQASLGHLQGVPGRCWVMAARGRGCPVSCSCAQRRKGFSPVPTRPDRELLSSF